MQRILLALLFVFFLSDYTLHAQTILNRGDLAIVGVNAAINSTNKDEISFVCFKDITNGTEIQILDAGYENCIAGYWSCGQEGGAKLTRTGGTILAGTVITFTTANTSGAAIQFNYPDANWSVADLYVNAANSNYSVLASNLNMNSGGDQIYFAQGGTWTELSSLCNIGTSSSPRISPNANFPGNNGRVLFGFTTNGWASSPGSQSSGESTLYPGMTCFSMSPTNGTAFNKYTGPLTATTQTAWLTRIATPSNWTTYNTSAAYSAAAPIYNITNFTIPITTGGGIPTATWVPPASVLCTDGTSINLNSLVTGTTGGTWSGTGVSGNSFDPTGLNGSYNITYTVNFTSGANTCPISQTSSISVISTAAPTVVTPINYCNNATATALTAVGSNLLWYTVANGGASSSTAPTPNTLAVTNTNYYVTQTVSGCESPRALIVVNVNSLPIPVFTTAPAANICVNDNATYITKPGQSNYVWTVAGTLGVDYTIVSGGFGSTDNAVTIKWLTVGTKTVTVNYQTNNCAGATAASSSVNVSLVPATPTISGNASFCPGASTILTSSSTTNNQWFLNGNSINGETNQTITVSAAGNYSVTVTNAGNCSATSNVVTVTAGTAPPVPTVTSPVVLCQFSTASALTAGGSNLLWYDALTGGSSSSTAPTPLTTSVSSTNYFVSQTVGCESPRVQITVIVNAGPAKPFATTPVNYCLNATASPLTAFGTGLLWYTVATGGSGSATAPVPLTTAITTTTYWVSQTSGGCESPRTQIDVIIKDVPLPPSVVTPIAYCQNAPASPLIATGSGGTLLWYTVLSGGTGNATAPTPPTSTVTTLNYYVSQTVNGCASTRANIEVNINASPSINAVTNQTLCTNAFTNAISFSGTGNAIYSWTNNNTSIGLAASGTGNIASFQAINTGSSAVVATITATPIATSYAYVANYGSILSPGNTVSVINTTTNAIAASITVGNNPFGVSVSNDGTRVYVSNYSSNSVSVINTSTNTVISTISVGTFPMGIIVSADGSRVYVANQISNNVSVINTATNTVIATIPVSLQPQGVAISADGTRLYVANVNSNNVSVINTATNTVLNVIGVGSKPITVAISADASKLYVPNYGSNTVSVVNVATNTVIASPSVGTFPDGVAISPDGSKVYITNQGSNDVSVLNTVTNTVTTTIAVGSKPQGVSFTTDGSKALVANYGSNNVSVINATSNTVITNVAVASSPYSLGNFITPSSTCNGAPISFTITVNPTSNATYSYANNPYCANGFATPTITGTLGGVFSGSGVGLVIDANTGVIDLAASTPGGYTPKYNLTTCGNFTTTASITINPLPTQPVVALTQPSCSVVTGAINITSPLGAYAYSIDGINFQSSPTFNTVSPATYIVTAKDAVTGCTNKLNNVTINSVLAIPSSPNVALTQPSCTVPTGTITITSPTGTGLTYSIDGINYTNTSGVFTSLAPNTYNVTVKNAVGCVSAITVANLNASIVNFANPIAVVTQPTCTTATGTITVTTPLGAYTYSIDGTYFQSSPIFSNVAVANYTVTVKNNIGCIKTTAASVIAPTGISVPLFTTTQPSCSSTTGSIIVTAPIGSNYSYSIDGTNFQSATLFSTLIPKSYTVTVKDNTGCINTSSFTINAAPAAPSAPTVTTPVAYCQGDVALPLLANGSNLLWYTSLTGGASSNVVPIPSTTTATSNSYFVSQTVNGCESVRSTIIVNVNPILATPVISYSTPLTFCEGDSVVLTSSAVSGNQWYKNNVLITGATSQQYTVTKNGNYHVVVTNASNCSSASLPVTAVVYPLPIVSAGPDVFVLEGDSAMLQGSASGGAIFKYLWLPNIYLSSDTIAKPWVINPPFDMLYLLKATNENGCSATDMVMVKVLKDLIIPNVFSPNGDGINDTWVIPHLSDYLGCTVEIFNRGGQLIFKSIGYNNPWDGTFNGKPLPVGTYYFIINPKNGRKVKAGTLTILR